MVARVFGSKRPGPRRVPISALGSSEPAETTPRGRWYLNERPIRWTPLASSAEARVSPARPGVGLAVEGEADAAGVVDAAAVREAVGWSFGVSRQAGEDVGIGAGSPAL